MYFFNDLNKEKILNHIFSIFVIALILVIFEIILFYYVIIPQLKNNLLSGIINISNILKQLNINLSINSIIDNILDQILENNIDNLNNKINENIDNLKNELKNELKNIIKDELKNELKNKNYIIENFNEIKKRRFKTSLLNKITQILIKYNIKLDNNSIEYIKIVIDTNFDEKLFNILLTLDEEEKILIDLNNNSLQTICIIIVLAIIMILYFIYLLIKKKNPKGVKSCTYIYTFFVIFFIILFQINFYFFSKKYKYIGNLGEEEILFYLFN
jgi:predicted PurR-regulated permease PerM